MYDRLRKLGQRASAQGERARGAAGDAVVTEPPIDMGEAHA